MLAGSTVVAYSPFRERADVLEIATARVGAGRLALRVVDENGQPVRRAAVYQSDYDPFPRSSAPRAALADADGRLLLTGLPSGETRLRAEAVGDAPLPEVRPDEGGPFPPDQALVNRRRWPAVTINVRPDAQTRLTLQPVRVGWLRGRVRGAPAGWFWPPFPLDRTLGTGWRYDRATGEYLIGPLPPGPFAVVFVSPAAGGVRETVTIAAGQVTRRDFTPNPRLPNPAQAEADARRRVDELTGSVFLPDGRTPAAGARVLLFDPARAYPVLGSLWADGAGTIRPAPFAYPTPYLEPSSLGKSPEARRPGGPNAPVLVALLPGSHGAVLAPAAAPGDRRSAARLVLPPVLTIRGHVTVGGRPFGPGRAGTLRVFAACTGQGRLNDLLSLETTAQSDGAFTLAGLTPGVRYAVQAALDDVWLSAPTVVTAGAPGGGGAASPLTLDIPEPGAPVLVTLGRRHAGARAHLADPAPAGPLTERYRPAFYIADGAGRLRLEGLCAGRRRVRLSGGRTITVTVPSLEGGQ